MEVKKPTAEQMAKFKKNAQDPSLSAEVRAKFQAIVDKFSEDVKDVEDKLEGKPEPKKRAGRKPATPKSTKKPATPRGTKKTATDIEKAKAEIKAKTGKTEEECEAIIEQYRALRTKAQEGKRKAEQASADNKKRVEKLENKGDLIEGTNVKTADAVIESTAKDVAEKIEQQIEAVEQKAEKEAKAEVAKDNTIKTPKDKKEAVQEKVDEKVKKETKVVVERVVIDTSALLTSIATTLGKFDKDSQKEFLIKLRSDIDKLLAKYAFGGMTDGATQVMNIQQSNLSSSSVNPTMFANGGGIMADGRIVLRTFNGVGGNKNKTYKLIKDDRDSDGKPYYTLIEDQSGNVMAQGDSFDEVNGYANLMSGKFANGGGVEDEELHYWEVSLKMPNGEIVYESVIADSKEDAEYYGELTDSANDGGKVLSVKSIGKEKFAKGGGVDKLPANLKKRLGNINNILKKYGGRPLTEQEAIRWNIDNQTESGWQSGESAFDLSGVDTYKNNPTRREYHTIGDALIDISYKITGVDYDMRYADIQEILKSKGNKFADGGKIATNLSLEETKRIANETAKALGKDFKLTEESLEVASFDLDFQGEPYDGGSYLIFENGDVVNYAISYKPIAYNYKTKKKFATGGVVGQEIVFDYNGEENTGVIKEITNLGDYVVRADNGRTLLAQRDMDVISLGAMRQQGVEQRKKRFGFFDEGGNVSDIEYDDVLAVLEEKLTDSVQELPNSFENSYNAEGEEVEHQSRDGFIAYTDGGYEIRWFEYLSYFYSSGYSLPTKALEKEKDRQIDLSLEDAKDYFKGQYPEIVEELGEENIDYNSLYEAGYESEAEELSEAEMENMDGTIMCEIGAYYYTPNNDRGIEGEHTLRLFGLVNLESPYHRSGNLEDRYDIDITFNSIDELAEKVDEGLKEIIDWFNGSHYFKSTEELRIRRMAKGGLTEHGLRVGDEIEVDGETLGYKDKIVIKDSNNGRHIVDLDKGERSRAKFYRNGGNVEREKFDKLIGKTNYDEFYFLDDIFAYKDGFKGATGTSIIPVSKEHYDYATSREGILERYMDAMGEEEWLDTLGLDSDDFEDENEMIEAIEEGIYDMYLNGGLDPFEQPNYEIEEQMRALPEFSDEDKYPIFEVVGGGRIFGKDVKFEKIYNQKLYNQIRKVEEFAKGGKLWIDTKKKGGLKGVKPSRKNSFRKEAQKRGISSGTLASRVLANPSRYKGINPKSAQLVKNMGVRKHGGSIGDILRNRRGE